MKKKNKKHPNKKNLEWDKSYGGYLPTYEGVFLALGVWQSSKLKEIDVYMHPIKGLCCFSEDLGSGGAEVDDETDCHVSVQCTGLEFVRFVRLPDKER